MNVSSSFCVRLFTLAMLLHTAFWTFAPPFILPNYHIDTLEMMVIGENWVLSTFKHPAFQGWAVEIYGSLFNDAEFVPYLAAQTACFISVLAVWQLAKKFLSPKLALLAALSLLSYFYFNIDSTVYNNRTFMRCFYILSVYFLYNAFENNKKRCWILTGLCLGLGIYCKFTILILVLSILIFMFINGSARKYWKTSGPYLSTAVCFFVVLPLLIWTVQNHFPQYAYASHSISKERAALWEHFWSPLRFSLNQLPQIAVMLLPVYPVLGFRWQFDKEKLRSEQGKFLFAFLLYPFILQLAAAFAAAGDMRTALGCHLWLLLPLFLLYFIKGAAEQERYFPSSVKIVFINIVFFAVLATTMVQIAPLVSGKGSRYHFGGKFLAGKVQQIWYENGGTGTVPFVRGDDWLCENTAVYLKPHPKVFSPLWSDEDEFAAKGGVLLWLDEPRLAVSNCFGNKDFQYNPSTGRPDEWLERFPDAKILPPLEIPYQTCIPVHPAVIHAAVVPPNKSAQPLRRKTAMLR